MFLLTPIPWGIILFVLLYRHDLSRLLHPLNDRCSLKDWEVVLSYLEIQRESERTDARQERSRTTSSKETRYNIWERYPNVRFYAFVLAVVTMQSLLSSLVAIPVLFGGASFLDSRFGAPVSMLFQLIAAVPSVFAMERYFGFFASAPHKFHLRRRRMGSLLRYSETLEST